MHWIIAFLFYTCYMFSQFYPHSLIEFDVVMKVSMKIFFLSNWSPYVVVDGYSSVQNPLRQISEDGDIIH